MNCVESRCEELATVFAFSLSNNEDRDVGVLACADHQIVLVSDQSRAVWANLTVFTVRSFCILASLWTHPAFAPHVKRASCRLHKLQNLGGCEMVG